MEPSSSNETVQTQLTPADSNDSVLSRNDSSGNRQRTATSATSLRSDEEASPVDREGDDDQESHHDYQHDTRQHHHCPHHHPQEDPLSSRHLSRLNSTSSSIGNPLPNVSSEQAGFDNAYANPNRVLRMQNFSTRRTLYSEVNRLLGSNSRRAVRGIWNSNVAPFFATLICCLNFYTICRFSILTYFLRGESRARRSFIFDE